MIENQNKKKTEKKTRQESKFPFLLNLRNNREIAIG